MTIYRDGASAKLELKFSTVCKTAWAKITLSRPAKTDGEATALVVRNTDNKQYSCASPGGNGEINKGQMGFCRGLAGKETGCTEEDKKC